MQPTSAQETQDTGMFAFVGRWCGARRKRFLSSRRTGSDVTQTVIIKSASPDQVTRQVTRAGPDQALALNDPGAPNSSPQSDTVPTHQVIRQVTPPHINPGHDNAKLLDNVPASLQAKRFVEYFSDGLFDLDRAKELGVSFTSYEDMGVHRFWQCPRSKTVFAEVLAPVVQDAYTEFCAHEWLVEHKWQTFARHLSDELQSESGPRKTYTTATCEDTGNPVRLRCYRFPVPDDALGEGAEIIKEAA